MFQPKQLRVQGHPISSLLGLVSASDDPSAARPSIESANPSVQELFGHAVQRQEAVVAANGALCVRTGNRTGRSPKDRFIVRDPASDPHIDWGQINQPFDRNTFEQLWQRVMGHLAAHGDYFSSRLQAGADELHSIPLRVITEYAWHNLFARQLFIVPRQHSPARPGEWMVVNAPRFKTDPQRDGTASDGAVIIDFFRRRILLAGMKYAGEMKKAVFTVMNYLLPQAGVLPMHCAANLGPTGDVALFFGLSGTGKTTLSADPDRFLIGDDEHGWNEQGIFNFEGGCYAKCINLTQEREPVIWEAIKFGAIMENVVLDHARFPRYDDAALTENTRVAYPREHVENRVEENRAGHPSAILFLTCDLFGVLPPVAVLDERQAAYHFLSGYTALVAGTELGSGIKPTFSACFGAPFFPRRPVEYAEILMRKLSCTGYPGLSRQHRLDRRRLWQRRPSIRDRHHARDRQRHPRRLDPEVIHRVFAGAQPAHPQGTAERRTGRAPAESPKRLGRPIGIRPGRRTPGRAVQREFQALRRCHRAGGRGPPPRLRAPSPGGRRSTTPPRAAAATRPPPLHRRSPARSARRRSGTRRRPRSCGWR